MPLMPSRGKLLIKELPSVLKKHGEEFLQVRINLEDRVIESNLQQELVLGEAKFDPFALVDVMDRIPGTVAFWNTLLVETKEKFNIAERDLKVKTSYARILTFEIIRKLRPEGTGKKLPTQAEVGDYFNKYFLNNDIAIDEGIRRDENLVKRIIDIRSSFKKVQQKHDELQGQVERITIIHSAWREKSFMIRAQVELMRTLISQNMMKIPEERRVYENW